MLHAAQAALAVTRAKTPKSHAGVLNLFGEHFIKTGRMDRRFAQLLRDAAKLRQTSDYDIFAPVEQPQVSEMVQNAEAFVAEVKRLLEKQGSW